MGIRKYKPTTPGRRGSSVADFVEITRETPEKSLVRPLPKSGGKKPGFALMPAFNGPLSTTIELGPNISVDFASDLDTQGGIALMFRPGTGVEMLLGFDKPGTPVSAKGSGRVEVRFSRADRTPIPLLGQSVPASQALVQAHPLTVGPRVTLHPQDAGAANLADGAMAKVSNAAGTATLQVVLDDRVAVGSAWVERGYGATAALAAGNARVEAA